MQTPVQHELHGWCHMIGCRASVLSHCLIKIITSFYRRRQKNNSLEHYCASFPTYAYPLCPPKVLFQSLLTRFSTAHVQRASAMRTGVCGSAQRKFSEITKLSAFLSRIRPRRADGRKKRKLITCCKGDLFLS